ncbi:gamma-glutamyltransferase [Thalassotalea crassostreae]|uniref:gamma-glutamyltransferase n=1 Tax=Thalassotalea crassostreae TaxID=1763536 RepID=UPI000837B00F|nr:gamma-glutamyltransferase [Thalassotalea crassostreae]
MLSLLNACVVEEKVIREDREPEATVAIDDKSVVSAQKFMVAAANPYASQAGFNILQKGGSAVDAAIAVQLVLTLVEPQSSGIGGGAFILHYDNETKHLTSFDGRETAPRKATQDLFLNEQGQPVRWIDAIVGGRSVGVPGVLKALELAHQKHGKLPWSELFIDAINLAEQGFIVSERLSKLLSLKLNPGLLQLQPAKQYFYPNNRALVAGTRLFNPQLAHVYKEIAKNGADVFYQGWLAKNIVKAVQNSARAPGRLTTGDLSAYHAKEVDAVCGGYRQYKVCGMAPPSSGGISVLQILKQLEQFDIKDMPVNGVDAIHLFTQSSRLAFADRAKYIADPAYAKVPVNDLISDSYIKQRSALINPSSDMGKAQPGEVKLLTAQALDNAIEMPSTSHISIVDGDGNAISMTTSIEMAFGSAVFVDGFLLNNQLTDFSLAPVVNGKQVANRLQPNKRPRSSMSPTMVFNSDGSLRLVVGSPGGSRIINYVSQTLIAVLDWELDIQNAINLPKVTNRNDITSIEKATNLVELKPMLEAKGHQVSVRDLNSGIHGIEVFTEFLRGGADPRREGKVLGQ